MSFAWKLRKRRFNGRLPPHTDSADLQVSFVAEGLCGYMITLISKTMAGAVKTAQRYFLLWFTLHFSEKSGKLIKMKFAKFAELIKIVFVLDDS